MFEEYSTYDAVGLSELIGWGEVSPKEVLEAAIRKAESLNPTLNAIVSPLYDYARARVANDEVHGSLAYVPFLLKDVHHALEGTPMSNGSSLHKGEPSSTTSEIVKRWLAAGLVPFGKTNTPEYKLSPTTNPSVWGPTRNPFDATRTPAGSSGGSAAAVAAGIVPLASATDEAGSIRTPSSHCGVFGLKPSRGRNPVGPDLRWELAGLSTSHVISRTVRDSAAALDATAGPEPGSPYCPPEGSFLGALSDAPPHGLRVALCLDRNVFGRPMEPACLDAIQRSGELLSELGHDVEEVAMPYDESEVMRLGMVLIAGSFGGFVEELVEHHGASKVDKGLEPITRFIWKVGRAMPSSVIERARFRAHALTQTMARFHERYDVLVNTNVTVAPKLIEEVEPTAADVRLAKLLATPLLQPLATMPGSIDKILDAQVESMVTRMPYRTTAANLTGAPAMSVPLFSTGDGLPIGVQFQGTFASERMLLQLAAQLEAAERWVPRLP